MHLVKREIGTMTATTAATDLRSTILDALDVAIADLRERPVFCAKCKPRCDVHQEALDRAARFAEARDLIARHGLHGAAAMAAGMVRMVAR